MDAVFEKMSQTIEKQTDSFLLRLRKKDTPTGVSVGTLSLLLDQTGLSKTELTHLALREFANKTLRRYEDDEGRLTDEQIAAIRAASPGTATKEDEFDEISLF